VSNAPRFFIPLPWEFFDAWLLERRVKRTHILSAFYIAARCFEARNTSGGVAPIELSTVARLCDVSTETIRRALHDLREWGWLDFQAGDGGDPAWRLWLTGLSIESGSPRPLHDLSTETPPPTWRALSTDASDLTGANPRDERESAPSASPQRDRSKSPKRDETRPQETKTKNPRSEEKLDHVVVETTATDPGVTDRLVAKIERPEQQRNEAAPVDVEQAGDGSIVWSREAQEGEAGVLADCDALVNAGLGEWIEDDGDRLLNGEELAERGTLPLGELRRRHERGQL
jgi:hypothetical protein